MTYSPTFQDQVLTGKCGKSGIAGTVLMASILHGARRSDLATRRAIERVCSRCAQRLPGSNRRWPTSEVSRHWMTTHDDRRSSRDTGPTSPPLCRRAGTPSTAICSGVLVHRRPGGVVCYFCSPRYSDNRLGALECSMCILTPGEICWLCEMVCQFRFPTRQADGIRRKK